MWGEAAWASLGGQGSCLPSLLRARRLPARRVLGALLSAGPRGQLGVAWQAEVGSARGVVGCQPGHLTPALSKTKPVVCACVEGVSLCPALGPCHCLHELFVWLDSPLFKREKFLLRSY